MNTIQNIKLEPGQAALWFLGQAGYVLPNHYDLMELNAENPQTFAWFCQKRQLRTRCVIPPVMQPFVWA